MSSASALGGAAVFSELSRWLRAEPGSLIAALEQQLMATALPDLFGYHIVQLGSHHVDDLITCSRITHQVRVNLGDISDPTTQLHCAEEALPFASNSIDVLLLPHVLEFANDPRRVLREAERVLIGEGHIVLLVFNPLSCFGMESIFRRWQGLAPWNGHFISAARAKDWLQLLGFDIVRVARAGYRPLLRHNGLNRRLQFLERLGAFCWPALGNVYVLVGRKRVEGVTPLKTSWRQRRRVLAGTVVEPTARAGSE